MPPFAHVSLHRCRSPLRARGALVVLIVFAIDVLLSPHDLLQGRINMLGMSFVSNKGRFILGRLSFAPQPSTTMARTSMQTAEHTTDAVAAITVDAGETTAGGFRTGHETAIGRARLRGHRCRPVSCAYDIRERTAGRGLYHGRATANVAAADRTGTLPNKRVIKRLHSRFQRYLDFDTWDTVKVSVLPRDVVASCETTRDNKKLAKLCSMRVSRERKTF